MVVRPHRRPPAYSHTSSMVGEIEIPWSDGDQRHWPREHGTHDQASRGYYSLAVLTHSASIQWRTKLGIELAKDMALPNGGTGYILKDWPEGYALFIHHKGTRKDKYLYGLREGYFRSAAEFLPHASWLMKSSTEPSTACSCRFCSKPRAAATGTTPPWPASPKPRLPSTSKTLLDAVLKEPAPGSPPPPPGGDRATATPPQSPTRGGVRRSKRLLVNRNPEIAPVQTSRIIAYYVRIPTPVDSSASSCNHQSPTGLWPISHELVWCRLQKPLEGSSATIYFWPGIIKSHEERSTGTIFHVSPLGNKHDIPFKIDQLLPYQAYRMEGTLVRELHRHATGSSRISLLNLEKVAGSKLDDDRFSIISSTCIFAIEFCQQLSVVWSCTADQGPHQPSSPTHRLRSGGQPGLQTPRYPRRKEYNTLWWGPERIRSQQMVRLKVPLSSIHLNQKASNAQFVQWVEGSSHKATVFLKIRSIFSESSEVRKDALSTTPFVSGGLFALIFESDPRAPSSGGECDLPLPPKGNVFYPLLKKDFEAVVPIAFIGGRYYPEIPGNGAIQGQSSEETRLMALTGLAHSADTTIGPTVYKATRAQMVEFAYREGKGRAQSIISGAGTPLV